MKVGADTGTCNSGRKGSIRYNTTGNILEYCNSTTWVSFLAASTPPTDDAPTSFNFTDVTGQELSTLIVSNTLTISGFDGPVIASVSGSGSPQIQVNSGAWGSAASINSGDTLKVRLLSSSAVSTGISATVTVGSVSDTWSVTTKAGQTQIFVTANAYTGNLGGLAGADSICQSEAGTAGYGGTWKALLSDSSTNAKDRLTITYPVVRASNTSVVVASKNIWNAYLQNTPSASPVQVRTSTNFDGTKRADGTTYCTNWTATPGESPVFGSSGATDGQWLATWYNTCSAAIYLYCMKQ